MSEEAPAAPAAPALNLRMFAIPMVMLGINKMGIDLNDETIKTNVQIAFGVSQAVVVLAYIILMLIVKTKNDPRKLEVEEKEMSSGEDVKKMITFHDYDIKQIGSKLGTLFLGLCITCGVHYKWGYVQPLLIQSILQPLNFTGDPLFLIHFMCSDDTKGANKRPFKVDKPGFPGMDMLNPAKAEEKAEGKDRKKRGDEKEKGEEEKKDE